MTTACFSKRPVRRAGLACAALFTGVAFSAQAQTALNLAALGAKTVTPDEIAASLNVQATAPEAAQAQAAVNRGMANALALAKTVAGLTATTGSYNVYESTADHGERKPSFQASQGLQLVMAAPGGVPPDAFTGLVGQLQDNGLLLNSLAGDLSDSGRSDAEQAAIIDAIHHIQAQAAAIAATLNETVGRIELLNVSLNTPGPMPYGGPVMMMAAQPAPQAIPGKMTVQANVSATIALTAPH